VRAALPRRTRRGGGDPLIDTRQTGTVGQYFGLAGFALAGFLIQAYITPTVVVQAHRDAAGHVSADVAWKCVWDLVTMRRLHIEDFEGAETESLDDKPSMGDRNDRASTTVRLRLKSRTDSWLAQPGPPDKEDVWSLERRINAFRNCINCDAEEETTVIPGWPAFRRVGQGLMLFGGLGLVIGLPVRLVFALKNRRARPS
jgi:hypothetical protein